MTPPRSLPSAPVADVRLPVCRCGCGAAVPPRRRYYASAACRLLYGLRTSSEVRRAAVYARDLGVCAICGAETVRDARLRPTTVRGRLRVPPWARTGWEADHIVPVVEGGGVREGATAEEILENLRTLCRRCHARETAALAARRAAARRVGVA